ncbi:16S rRNA (guanine(966)-N(2))-methyltransferase RsmD [Reinekea sp.]|uniref:16S rRNA (guanine(966)-N(2))-methyltransferase RsmD n=1 Tax=Reinekea sp. TaxID=1970455 RepID=UPI003988C66F
MSKSKRAKPAETNAQLRIIGGRHRGRKLPIPSLPGLRPTPDRIRETIFNWLQFDLHDKLVVDCFAGTGALGLESLSRGAASCQFVEPATPAAKSIESSLGLLKETTGTVHKTNASAFLATMTEPADLFFVDPPFELDLWQTTLEMIAQRSLLSEYGFVYVECPKTKAIELDETWLTVKDKTAGNLRIRLLQQVNIGS